MDEARNRYLRDRVLTASPAQRVVLLFDRLVLDLERARSSDDAAGAGQAIGHAGQIVAELMSSLDVTAGGPAQNLAQLYGFLINELVAARGEPSTRIDALIPIVTDLRDAFAYAAAATASTAASQAASAAAASIASGSVAPQRASAWVG